MVADRGASLRHVILQLGAGGVAGGDLALGARRLGTSVVQLEMVAGARRSTSGFEIWEEDQ